MPQLDRVLKTIDPKKLIAYITSKDDISQARAGMKIDQIIKAFYADMKEKGYGAEESLDTLISGLKPEYVGVDFYKFIVSRAKEYNQLIDDMKDTSKKMGAIKELQKRGLL
jgi:hypothetical protein